MKHLFWLRQGAIAGRPGPDHTLWDLDEINANRFSAILSVNDGEAVHQSRLAELGIEYANIPMSDNAPARDGDLAFCLENLPRATAFVGDNMAKGPVLVHCRSGKDRTGMVLAACLIEFEGLGPEAAMAEVLEVRPIAFSAEGWKEFALAVLDRYNKRNRP